MYLMMAQHELNSIAKELGKITGNQKVESLVRTIWFDVLSYAREQRFPILAKFTSSSSVYGSELPPRSIKFQMLKRLEEAVVTELEN